MVADEQLQARALELAAQLAQGPAGAFGATKRLLAHSLGAFESQMVLESESIAAHAVSADGREGIERVSREAPAAVHRQALSSGLKATRAPCWSRRHWS